MSAVALPLIPVPASAAVVAEAPRDRAGAAFQRRVESALAALERSEDPAIRQLHAAAVASPATITIRPITDDRATWHEDGDRSRGHTDPGDGRPKGEGRSQPTQAIIYMPPDGVEPRSARWRNGLLVHELVHGIDLAYGRYHRDYTVRERRAVFVQNVWRARQGYPLREAYHKRFATLDYQDAARTGRIDELTRYLFTRADFPPPPGRNRDGASNGASLRPGGRR